MKANATVQQYFGSDSSDKNNITIMGVIGNPSEASSSSAHCAYSSKYNNVVELPQ